SLPHCILPKRGCGATGLEWRSNDCRKKRVRKSPLLHNSHDYRQLGQIFRWRNPGRLRSLATAILHQSQSFLEKISIASRFRFQMVKLCRACEHPGHITTSRFISRDSVRFVVKLTPQDLDQMRAPPGANLAMKRSCFPWLFSFLVPKLKLARELVDSCQAPKVPGENPDSPDLIGADQE